MNVLTIKKCNNTHIKKRTIHNRALELSREVLKMYEQGMNLQEAIRATKEQFDQERQILRDFLSKILM